MLKSKASLKSDHLEQRAPIRILIVLLVQILKDSKLGNSQAIIIFNSSDSSRLNSIYILAITKKKLFNLWPVRF